MFYEKQSYEQKEKYKRTLKHLASISKLFSESDKPLIYYRAHENCFCYCFGAENLARHDCSIDAKKGNLGIGLKTWVNSNNQKIAEFGKLKSTLDSLDNKELIIKISKYRNERIKTTRKIYGIDKLIYHIVKRDKEKIIIAEYPFEYIDIKNLQELPEKNSTNTVYFTDKKHIYNFNKSKTTLYMNFENLKIIDEIKVNIIDEPFYIFEELEEYRTQKKQFINKKLCLKLYSFNKKRGNFIPKKSGLNQWNAGGRKRHPNEIYIFLSQKKTDHVSKIKISFPHVMKILF